MFHKLMMWTLKQQTKDKWAEQVSVSREMKVHEASQAEMWEQTFNIIAHVHLFLSVLEIYLLPSDFFHMMTSLYCLI